MSRLLICLFLFFSLALNAQETFSFDPGGVIEEQAAFDEYSVYQIDILNLTSDTLQLTWRLIEKTFPEGWEISLCDNVACYGGLPNSNDFYPIFGDNNGFIKLVVNPFQITGTMEFVFLIFPTGYPDDYEEMRFTITAGETTATQDPILESVNIWPNPVTNNTQLKNNSNQQLSVRLINVTGKVLDSFIITPQDQKEINSTSLESGMYLLQYFAEDTLLGTQKLIKQ
jgi:hypothetical protein